eukprot:gene14388-20390_t
MKRSRSPAPSCQAAETTSGKKSKPVGATPSQAVTEPKTQPQSSELSSPEGSHGEKIPRSRPPTKEKKASGVFKYGDTIGPSLEGLLGLRPVGFGITLRTTKELRKVQYLPVTTMWELFPTEYGNFTIKTPSEGFSVQLVAEGKLLETTYEVMGGARSPLAMLVCVQL